MRGYSYDYEAYFNHQAKLYNKTKTVRLKAKHEIIQQKILPETTNTKEHVEYLINGICCQRIDLTSSYDKWFAIGSALASEFGEQGRYYFHQVSQFHSEYNYEETDNQFNGYLNTHSFSIGSFFYYCRMVGILK